MKFIQLAAVGLLLAGVGSLPAATEGSKLTAEERDFFERNIRPVLQEKCYKCHSSQPDAKIKAGLALDNREALLKGGDSGAVIVPGKPADSLLIKSLQGKDPDLLMPPEKAGGKLSPEVIAAFEKWVKMGAPDPRTVQAASKKYGPDAEKAKNHPFFNPVQPVTVPAVKDAKWVRTPVDNFVLAKLEAAGMQPSPVADKRTLIRRAYFDLTGLPPLPEEVDAFLADKSSKAFEKVVDRLLQSPQYGERWGRYWLDVARYGDTMGDTIRNKDNRYLYSYTYRDYVIRAFNDDKPYDQFLKEQLAADRLPLGEDKSALAALGFLTLGNRFGNDANQIIDDRIDVVCRGTMGLTVSCARCHDHKFDPITMKDYYGLHGVFNNVTEPAEPPLMQPVKATSEYTAFQQELQKLEADLAEFRGSNTFNLTTNQHARVGDYLLAVHDFSRVDPAKGLSRNTFFRERDLDTITANTVERQLKTLAKKFDPIFSPWVELSALNDAEFAAKAGPISARVCANADAKQRVNPLVARLFATPPKDMKELAKRYGEVFLTVDRQWLAKTNRPHTVPEGGTLTDPAAEAVRQVLYADNTPFALAERDIRRLTSQQTEARENLLIRKVNDLKVNHPGSPPRAMVLEDVSKPRDSAIFLRGNPGSRGDVVPREFLNILAGGHQTPFKDGSGRLDLANDIASKDNPLTARVMVNRIWLHHFGQGIVSTPSDFGLVGEPPTHPELLDWLAGQFMERGWSIKAMHRLILLSATWQQRSDDNPRYSATDQGNLLLWRQNRYRLDFEGTRDTLLAVSGTLDRSVGGQPVDLAQDPSPVRRTVYGTVNRAALPEFFNTFDFAPPDISSPKRVMTTVPQQALFMLNSPFVLQQAKSLAARSELAKASGSDQKIKALYRLLYQRAPSSTELELARQFVQAQLNRKPEVSEPPAWKYGYGAFDAATKRVKPFTALPQFESPKWHGGNRLPQWLSADGGFAGAGSRQAVIRRWVAPQDGTFVVSGRLSPKDLKAAGVSGRIVTSRTGEVGLFTAKGQAVEAAATGLELKRGDTIDFVVESLDAKTGAAFLWAPVVARADRDAAEAAQERYEWHAQSEFSGPPPPPLKGLSPWEKYAQVMLLSNEVIFVN